MDLLDAPYNVDQTIRERVEKYAHDGFFHYLISRHGGLRLMLCQKMVPEAKLVSTKVVKNEFYGDFKNQKKLILDVAAKDEKGRIYNIELQCYGISDGEIARFQTYGFRIVTLQATEGKPYDDIKKVRQMIINASKPIKGLDQYIHYFTFKDENGIEMPNALYEMTLVQLPYLDIEKNADDFNQLMYLFQNNRMCDKIKADKKIEEAVIMHDEYIKSEEMFAAIERERDRLALKTYQNQAKKEGLALGVKRMIVSYAEKVFNEDIAQWLETLNDEQLEMVEKNIFTIANIEELKTMINRK